MPPRGGATEMTPARWQRELDGRDAYEILGIAPTASSREISKAKRTRLAAAHPDAGAGSDYVAKLITCAATILLDEAQRREYDRWRAGPPADPAPAPSPSLWDDAEQGFTPAPRDPPSPRGYRGTSPARPPGPVPGPGPGAAPTYGSPHVMPHLGQPPPQYYHQPQPPRSRTGLVLLVVGGSILLVCLGMCLLNLMAARG